MADSDTTGNIVESRFKAFVSYSHADKAAAQKLHRKLETYRLPKHLRQPESSTTDEKPVDGRIGPIFRDREDLPAAEDLSESVKKALTVSEALIVLCSPDAQKSPWVAREIELFRELHPDRPVLAAILRGEPEEAFPEPLRQGGEPLAADLRKEGDGARLGFLKVVAGIAGVPLDALINRDAQRRVRRVTAITVAAVAAMVVMALMTTFALQARNEAREQRAEAEGMVEYMLTELRQDLRGVGRLDVMADVNERAIQYYERQSDLESLPVENLERRARVLHALGEDETNRKGADMNKALSMFREAHRVTAQLLERDQENPDRIFAHAQSEYWVGWVFEKRRQFDGAFPHYINYLNLATRLHRAEGETVRSLMELGYAENNIGILLLRGKEQPELASDRFTQAVRHFKNAYLADVDNHRLQLEIANATAWHADTFFSRQMWGKSLDLRMKERRHLERYLVVEPNSKDAAYRMLVNLQAVEIIEANKEGGVFDRANLNSLLRRADQLISFDPENAVWAEAKARIIRDFEALKN